MKQSLISLFTFMLIVFSACETPTEYTAEQYTISELSNQPGYAWLNQRISDYTPNAAVVAQIKTSYQANPANFTLFVNPSCTCTGTQQHFPRFISSIRAAGIPDNAVTIYSMRGIETKHPKSDVFSVTALPTFFVTRGTTNVGKIIAQADTTFHVETELATILK